MPRCGISRGCGLSELVLGYWRLDTGRLAEHELALYLAGDGFLSLECMRMRFLGGHLDGDFQPDRWGAACRSYYLVRELHVENIVPADYATMKTRHKSVVLRQGKRDH